MWEIYTFVSSIFGTFSEGSRLINRNIVYVNIMLLQTMSIKNVHNVLQVAQKVLFLVPIPAVAVTTVQSAFLFLLPATVINFFKEI